MEKEIITHSCFYDGLGNISRKKSIKKIAERRIHFGLCHTKEHLGIFIVSNLDGSGLIEAFYFKISCLIAKILGNKVLSTCDKRLIAGRNEYYLVAVNTKDVLILALKIGNSVSRFRAICIAYKNFTGSRLIVSIF